MQGSNVAQKDPLTHRESLVLLERLFDIIIEAESIKQNQPAEENAENMAQRCGGPSLFLLCTLSD